MERAARSGVEDIMPKRPPRPSGFWLFDSPYLLLVCVMLLWSVNMILGRFIAGRVPPISLACVRWTGATLILLPFAWTQLMRDLPLIRRHIVFLTALAGTGIACYNAMSYYGLQYTQAVNGLLVQSIAPLLVALWSFFLFREKLRPGQMAGIVTSLVGVMVIISHGDLDTFLHLKPNVGDVWIISALVIYAFYAAVLPRRPPLGPLSFLAVVMALGALLLLPFALWEAAHGYLLRFDTVTLGTLAYVVIGPSLVAYLFFNRAVEMVGGNAAAPFLHLMPVFGTALAIVFLGETLAWYHFAGYVLVICGIALATLSARHARARPTPPQ